MMRRIVDRLSSVLRSFSFCFILHLSKDSRSTGVQMISRGQVIVINSGDQVHIECEFEAESFNLFDNPIWWRKAQRHEETQINMMGNLMEPFESTRRFKVAFQSKETRHRLGLTISNSGLEDSGNYTCEVNGPLNSLLGLVTHYLFIRAPVDDVFLVDNNSTEDFLFHQQRSLTYVEGIPTVFRCVAIGGYPPPEVSIFVGARDVTSQFGLSFSTQMSGVRGLRIMHYTTERWSSEFTAQAHDDSTLASCSVVVSGLASRTRTAKLEVYHAPVITCQSSWAHVGERNVFIRCSVKARPKVSTIFWIIDSNNTTVSEGQVVQEHWTLIMEQSGSQVDANLYIRQAKPEHFRKYTLFAENMIAGKSRDTHLLLKLQTPTIKELNLTRKVLTYSSNFDSHSSGVKEQLFVSKNTATRNLDFNRMAYFFAHLLSLLCYYVTCYMTSEIR